MRSGNKYAGSDTHARRHSRVVPEMSAEGPALIHDTMPRRAERQLGEKGLALAELSEATSRPTTAETPSPAGSGTGEGRGSDLGQTTPMPEVS